ncbi:MAG TPA: aspartyl/glutamyl-tRNA amidotransferase subunit C [Synergistales bacterium]|nr:aspartyl/glutamyl-tRNA amidotransferase subunit C [Synergistales bacterium]HPC75345.1 aspartyl/glutamyl-tRNA amidotransferase subunit C [Synergistales bacterium]HRS48218.1 aspartyl/glutamyl-tRNA amidotransferase subunit C [Thermovirgaceae bacterium]HRU90588.1 aspartyl/glutamyl-tRNA amidotransferase subunit C [Thermovirgaceae bacterium]
MEIDDKTIKMAATLSGIELEDEKTEAMAEFFKEMIGHFQGLEMCDVEGLDPFFNLDGSSCPFREDVQVCWENRDRALEAGGLIEGAFFIVPPIGGAEVADEI